MDAKPKFPQRYTSDFAVDIAHQVCVHGTFSTSPILANYDVGFSTRNRFGLPEMCVEGESIYEPQR